MILHADNEDSDQSAFSLVAVQIFPPKEKCFHSTNRNDFCGQEFASNLVFETFKNGDCC